MTTTTSSPDTAPDRDGVTAEERVADVQRGLVAAHKKNRPPKLERMYTVAVVGATGVVGQETLSILEERGFPVETLIPLASERSAGKTVQFADEDHTVKVLAEDSFVGVDIAFFAAGGAISTKYAPIAAASGAFVIDKSSVFRLKDGVPLVVPEVNDDALLEADKGRIVASPNCTTTPLVQVLSALHDEVGLESVVVSTYQSVSGAGQAGVEELEGQVRALFNMREAPTDVFGRRIAFNALPCVPGTGEFDDDGFTSEEMKIVNETRKILELPELPITATCVRVPVFNGHSEVVHARLSNAMSVERAKEVLSAAPGVVVMDDVSQGLYPTPVDASGEDLTLVGRIRCDTTVPHGLVLWLSSDNLRTGAALNAVRIAEHICVEHLS